MDDIKQFDLEKSIELSNNANITDIAVTDTDRFVEVISYIGDNSLFEKAVHYLQSRGYHQMMISVDAFRELQRFIRTGMLSGRISASSSGNAVIMCSKGNGTCGKPK